VSTLSFVRKVVSVPVYAAVLSTILVACGTVTVKEERRTKGQQSATTTTERETARNGNVAAVNRGLSLTLPTDMPTNVDTVSITLISEAKIEPVPLPAVIEPAGVPSHGIQNLPPCMLPPSKASNPVALGAPCGIGNLIAGLGQGLPWYPRLMAGHPLAAEGIGKLTSGEKVHAKKSEKQGKRKAPSARLGKNELVQPVAFIPLHWMDENRPAGCGFSSDGIGEDDPLAGFLDEKDPLADFVESDQGTAISSSTLNYYFGSDQKQFAIEELDPGTYVVVIELIDSNTGKVIESGETKVVVEAGKVAAANVKLTKVAATTGGVVITVERAPAEVVSQPAKI
jgi:hypothetical protein